jgi:arginyl-tRNA synthetase
MYDEFITEINDFLESEKVNKKVKLLQPPDPNLGDFCIVLNQYSESDDLSSLGNIWAEKLQKIRGIKEVSVFSMKGKKKPIIYLNFNMEEKKRNQLRTKFISQGLKEIYSSEFGYNKINEGKTAVVEHTSANPISPLHVGNLRNSVHGDTLARILERSGYNVLRVFYVNDVGLQVSFVVIGYEFVKNRGIKPAIKIDLWMGQIYAIMNCFYTIQTIKKRAKERNINTDGTYLISEDENLILTKFLEKQLEELNYDLDKLKTVEKLSKDDKNAKRSLQMEIKKFKDEIKEIQRYQEIFKDLQIRFPKLFTTLFEEVSKIDLIKEQGKYLKKYEKNTDEYVTSLFREVVDWVLEGFRWTLDRYNIPFDVIEYESDLTWSGLPEKVIDELADSEYTIKTGGKGVRFTFPKEGIDEMLKNTSLVKSDIPIKGQIPELQLRREDGTALYAAKDIAYSIQKFETHEPSIIYNVISTEQSLPQFQLLFPLYVLGKTEYASNLKHYAYEMVNLQGRPMSGRMAAYVTADAFYDETIIRARMAKRTSDANRGVGLPDSADAWNEENEILRAIALASTRYPLIDKTPQRRISLNIDEELDFKQNPGPFIEYAHARASGVIQTVKEKLEIDVSSDVDCSLILDEQILSIVALLLNLEGIILKSIRELDPSLVATWCYQLAQSFMKFYEGFPVLNAETIDLSKSRLAVVKAFKIGLSTGLEILGIPSAERI